MADLFEVKETLMSTSGQDERVEQTRRSVGCSDLAVEKLAPVGLLLAWIGNFPMAILDQLPLQAKVCHSPVGSRYSTTIRIYNWPSKYRAFNVSTKVEAIILQGQMRWMRWCC